MEKSKKFYWAVFAGKKVLFEGSFTACWQWFVDNFGAKTLGELTAEGIKIARQS